ncbi:MAG TPA: class I SAM-dependent methyltransferase [Candidatus Binatia bacterium]|nr:class I SAM-dependent methyltransferase [Candidatus Binatia bacterium]
MKRWLGRAWGGGAAAAGPSARDGGAAAAAARNVARGSSALQPDDIDWFHSIDLGDGCVTAGAKSGEDLRSEFARLGLDEAALRGKTVLDVGCADGWNSLECERLGAEVTAVDAIHRDGLRYVRRHLRPRFRFVQVDVLSPSFLELGSYDFVLYLGVLYHTPYAFDQLARVARVCRGTVFVESAFLNLAGHADRATLTFNFDGRITPDLSSPVFPSVAWITSALGALGFADVAVVAGGAGDAGHGVSAAPGRVLVRASNRRFDAMPLVFAAEQTAV